jgi:hypothetical protein
MRNDNSWKARGIKRRDFRHDKSGPEVAPYKSKKRKRKHIKNCKHEFLPLKSAYYFLIIECCNKCGKMNYIWKDGRRRWSL